MIVQGLLLLLQSAGPWQTTAIPADRDATLIEHPEGALANGSGPVFFAGRTSQPTDSIRRGLVHFDVAEHLPAGAIVQEASLELHCTQTSGGAAVVGLHRALVSWGEGASYATGGQGAPAEPQDATWLHRFYPDVFWSKPGGFFAGGARAATSVEDPGLYTWQDPKLAADVRLWLLNPAANHGWLLLGDESASTTVKRFESRESAEPDLQPVLRVTWRAGGQPMKKKSSP